MATEASSSDVSANLADPFRLSCFRRLADIHLLVACEKGPQLVTTGPTQMSGTCLGPGGFIMLFERACATDSVRG